MPSPFVITVVVTPVATFVIETVAPGTDPPDSSVTVPERVPPTNCEYPGMETRNQSVSHKAGMRPAKTFSDIVRVLMMAIILISPLMEDGLSPVLQNIFVISEVTTR
jgi:hypothetical protein